ncbi:MAG: hypothetical protein QM770_03675 [Tepidisphaeraceae bacterium]
MPPAAPTSVATPRSTSGDSADKGEQLRADKLERWLQKRYDAPARNLFALNLDLFPRADAGTAAKAAQPITSAQSDRFWDRLAKSITTQADLRRQRQIRLENVLAVAGKLRLQSTMITGGVPRAMIDGRLYKVGDVITVEGSSPKVTFRVDRIGARSVVLDRDEAKLELGMGVNRVRVLRDGE